MIAIKTKNYSEGWVPCVDPTTNEAHHFFVYFRSDALRTGMSPFELVGKVGSHSWGKFMYDVAEVGVFNERYEIN